MATSILSRFPNPVATPGYITAPNGGQIFYVDSGGVRDGFGDDIASQLYTSLGAALNVCRANRGDTIIVLPQHSESVTTTPTFVAGVSIIGVGNGAERPAFRWTTTGSQWAINVNNVMIQNCHLQMEGANGVVKAVLITGADVSILSNDIETASGAALKATIAIEVGSAAHRCNIAGNVIRGTATHNSTDVIKVVGATPPNQLRIEDNEIVCSATAANGMIHITVASTDLKVFRNYMYNTMTSSTACIVVDAVAADGLFADNYTAVLNNGTASSQGLTFGAGSLIKCSQNYCDDEANKSAILAPVAAT
jgi:hypothetical protein